MATLDGSFDSVWPVVVGRLGSKCWGGRWRMRRRRLEFLLRRRMSGCNGGVLKVKLASSTGRLGRTGVRPGCPETEQAVIADRVTEREGPHFMAGRLQMPRSTIYAVLKRRGLSRPGILIGPRVPNPLCEGLSWGAVDIKKLGRVPDGGLMETIGIENRGTRQKVLRVLPFDGQQPFPGPTPKSWTPKTLRPVPGSCFEPLNGSPDLGYRIDRVMTDNALAYTRGRAFTTTLDTIRSHPQTHPAVPSPDQRKGGTIPPDPSSWMDRQTAYQNNDKRRQTLTGFIGTIRPDPTANSAQSPITVLANHLCGKHLVVCRGFGLVGGGGLVSVDLGDGVVGGLVP